MDKEREKYLIDRYMEGKTTLQEEQELTAISSSAEQGLGSWSQYVANEKYTAPHGLADELWDQSELKDNKFSRIAVLFLTVALFLAILLAGYAHSATKAKAEHNNKALQEAFALLAEAEETKETEVLYQDNSITIYLSYD